MSLPLLNCSLFQGEKESQQLQLHPDSGSSRCSYVTDNFPIWRLPSSPLSQWTQSPRCWPMSLFSLSTLAPIEQLWVKETEEASCSEKKKGRSYYWLLLLAISMDANSSIRTGRSFHIFSPQWKTPLSCRNTVKLGHQSHLFGRLEQLIQSPSSVSKHSLWALR